MKLFLNTYQVQLTSNVAPDGLEVGMLFEVHVGLETLVPGGPVADGLQAVVGQRHSEAALRALSRTALHSVVPSAVVRGIHFVVERVGVGGLRRKENVGHRIPPIYTEIKILVILT